jgi:hypothetical protein
VCRAVDSGHEPCTHTLQKCERERAERDQDNHRGVQSNMDMVSMLTERRAVQRRNALRAMGIGVTALAAGSVATEAKGKKKAKDRCPRQVSSCEAAFAGFCSDPMFQEECLAAVRECCAPLRTCDAGSAMDCVVFRFLVA